MASKKINKILNKGALSQSEIHELATYFSVPIQSIVSMYNFKKPIKDGCYIILIHPSRTSNGHWVGLYKFGKHVLYHDSYGTPPPELIQQKCKGYALSWTTKEIQDLRSNYCGQYVVNFFRHVFNSNDPYIATEHYLNQWAG